ncbi:hypothetical protein GCK32_001265 [Trichostrongylus colubriformis]|uniref:Uncharacterized protein n=1 Tax=Trichostrongylus colubriformis TaxID=6319 RepID=A0AAN8F433_TRICO
MRSHEALSKPLLVPKSVFTVVVPKGKWLVIGIEVAHSHEVQAALDSDTKLIAPRTQNGIPECRLGCCLSWDCNLSSFWHAF